MAGHPLAYHWFATPTWRRRRSPRASTRLVVLTRLWVLPLIALTAAVLVAALREIGPRAHGEPCWQRAHRRTGGTRGLPWLDVPWDPVFAPLSPSQNYSYPSCFCVALVVRYLRGGARVTLVPLGVLLVLSPGVKASSLADPAVGAPAGDRRGGAASRPVAAPRRAGGTGHRGPRGRYRGDRCWRARGSRGAAAVHPGPSARLPEQRAARAGRGC